MKELQVFFRIQILFVVTYPQQTPYIPTFVRTVWTIENVPKADFSVPSYKLLCYAPRLPSSLHALFI